MNSDCHLSQAIKESWRITVGNFWKTVLVFAIVLLIVGVASAIILISFSFLAALALSVYFAANFVVSFALIAFAVIILLCPFQVLCCNFALVGVYSQLCGKANGRSEL